MEMGYHGVAVPGVPDRRYRSIDPDRLPRREHVVKISEPAASATAHFKQPRRRGSGHHPNGLRDLGIELDLMGLVRPKLSHGFIEGRIAVVKGRDLPPLGQAIGAVVNISAQTVQRGHAEVGPDETLEDTERRQSRDDSQLFDLCPILTRFPGCWPAICHDPATILIRPTRETSTISMLVH